MTLQEIKRAIRDKYAWPGGYPLYLIMDDGEAMGIDAARASWREIVAAHIRKETRSGWYVVAVDINYESDLICCQSGEPIEAAYPPD